MNRKTNRDRIHRAQYQQRSKAELDLAGGLLMAAICIVWCIGFWMWL